MGKFVSESRSKASATKAVVTGRPKSQAYPVTHGSKSFEVTQGAARSCSGSTAALESVRLLRSCPGKIESIEGSRVYVSLEYEGQLYDAEFQPAEFEAGVSLQVGQGVLCREFLLRDGAQVWLNQVYQPPLPSAREVKDQVTRLQETFQGTGL